MFSPDGLSTFCSGDAEKGYRLIYNIEIYLRLMLRWELVGEFGHLWKTMLGDAHADAKRLLEEEQALKLIDADERNILSYTLLTQIKATMISEKVWPLFKDQWPPQDMFLADFKTFNHVRHKAAHFRRLTARDMGVVERFETIVTEMTSHYRKQRRNTGTVTLAEPRGVPETMKPLLTDWAEDCETEDSRWVSIGFRRMSKYLVVDAQLRHGAFSPSAIGHLVDTSKTDALFLGLDATRGALRAYIPVALEERQVKLLIPALRSFQKVEEELYPEDIKDEIFDFVVPLEVELPMEFKL